MERFGGTVGAIFGVMTSFGIGFASATSGPFAPALIHALMSAISSVFSFSRLPGGINSFFPPRPERPSRNFTSIDSSAFPATIAAPSLPPFIKAANVSNTNSPSGSSAPWQSMQ